jgi:hypothetical protein
MASPPLAQLMATLFFLEILHLVARLELRKHQLLTLRQLRNYLLSPPHQVVSLQQVLLLLQLVLQANLVLAHLLLVVQQVVLSVQFKQARAYRPMQATELHQRTVVFLRQ